jgi:flagellar assembly protein FliH
MPLIKSPNAPSAARAFSMADIEHQARSILTSARQRAHQLVAAANIEAKVIRTEAHNKGYADGNAKGLAEGRAAGHAEGLQAGHDAAFAEHQQHLKQLVAALTAALSQIDRSRRKLEAAAVTDVLNLAISIAEKVTKRLGRIDPSVALANATEALRMVAHASDVRIAIHPSQREYLSDVLPKLKLQWPSMTHIELIDDESVDPGGCRVFTTHGRIDADLKTQLARIVADMVPEESLEKPAEQP